MVFCEGAPPEQRLNASFGRTGVPGGIYFRRESEADGWHLHAYNQDGFRDLIDVGSENVLVLGDSFRLCFQRLCILIETPQDQ